MKKKLLVLAMCLMVFCLGTLSWAQCPYDSVQIRVQINTKTPWATSTQAALDKAIHIGVFKNGWGVPIDQGSVTVYAVQGSYYQILSLSTWETWWKPGVVRENDTWTFHVYCGSKHDQVTATWGGQLDILSYVLPNWPQSQTGSIDTNQTNKGNYWRTYSNPGGDVSERFPGFYITKGGIDYAYADNKMWYFEQMIYDYEWIYLVRDTSWDAKCNDNKHVAGQLLFTYENNQWFRGGRHFPRFITNGGTKATGSKYVQGVERKLNLADPAQEGRWCTTPSSGFTSSKVYAEWIGRVKVGDKNFGNVLKLKIIEGSGQNDEWWFAKGYGLIYFTDGSQTESYQNLLPNFKVIVRIPCEPNPPCH